MLVPASMNARTKLSSRSDADSVDLYNDVASAPHTWKVRLPNGMTQAMTIQELDAAFDDNVIGLTTLVQRPAGGEWMTLGEAARVGEIAGDDDSIRPVSSDYQLVEIPKPPPLPTLRADMTLGNDEHSVILRPKKSGRRLAAVAMIGLLVGGIVAWRYMPARPMGTVATTTIMAPAKPSLAAAPLMAAAPLPPAPETTPAPEGNALAEQTIVGSPGKGGKTIKSTGKPKAKTTWKQRMKLHAKAKKNA